MATVPRSATAISKRACPTRPPKSWCDESAVDYAASWAPRLTARRTHSPSPKVKSGDVVYDG
jgi:hypothetical protein